MDRILIILKKENGPRASSASALGFKYHNIQTCLLVYATDSGERLQDHWSSGFISNSDRIALCITHSIPRVIPLSHIYLSTAYRSLSMKISESYIVHTTYVQLRCDVSATFMWRISDVSATHV